jgi:hypothetical protein
LAQRRFFSALRENRTMLAIALGVEDIAQGFQLSRTDARLPSWSNWKIAKNITHCVI